MAVLRLKRATLSRWTQLNPVLDPGEPGYETDTHTLRFGDGETAFLDLPQLTVSSEVVSALLTNPDFLDLLDTKASSTHQHTMSDIVGWEAALEAWLLTQIDDEDSPIRLALNSLQSD